MRLGMVPIGEQRPQGREQYQRLVEHRVMAGLGQLDHGCDPAERLVHLLTDVGCDESVLRSQEREPARDL